MLLQPIESARSAALLALNNAHAEELSLLDTDTFVRMSSQAFLSRCIGEDAFVFAFDQDANYASPNFLWFKERYRRYVYVDRIVVAARTRGRGLAAALYAEVFRAARAAKHDRVVCEVNIRPANPRSDAFHERLGFVGVGAAEISGGTKTVRYLERLLRA